ncbi:MAG: hypothetical protein J0I07_04935 [Myxococcales bacterium]|nr:hypothetical protein [Myxococcales bacterium]
MDGRADLEVLGRDSPDAFEGSTGQRWVCTRDPADGHNCAALLRDAVAAQAREIPNERSSVINRDTCGLSVCGCRADGAGDGELCGDIAKPLANGGFFLVRTGTKGGHIHLAAPEVTSDELVIGQAVKSRSSLKLAEARTKSGAERRVIAAYRSMPPRLVPAAPKAQLAD